MGKVGRNLPIEQVSWIASALGTRQIPKVALRNLQLELNLAHNTDGTSLTLDNVLGSVGQIELTANGQDNLIKAPFAHFYYMNYLDFAVAQKQSVVKTASPSYVFVRVPFVFNKTLTPDAGVLDARALNSLVLSINFNAAAIVDDTTDVTVTSGYVDLLSDEYSIIGEEPTVGTLTKRYTYQKYTPGITGINQVSLPAKGKNQYTRIFLYCRDVGSSKGLHGDLTASIFSLLELKSRDVTFQKFDENELIANMTTTYGITPPTGVYVLDLLRKGDLTQRLRADLLDELILELTIEDATNSYIDIVMEQGVAA